MEVTYIIDKELPVLDENIFSANLTENNKMQWIILKKDRTHLLRGLKTNKKNKNKIIDLNETLAGLS